MHLRLLKKGWRLFPPKGWSFPIYKYMNEILRLMIPLRQILPSEGNLLAKEYAETLVNTHKELYPLIEKFGMKFK